MMAKSGFSACDEKIADESGEGGGLGSANIMFFMFALTFTANIRLLFFLSRCKLGLGLRESGERGRCPLCGLEGSPAVYPMFQGVSGRLGPPFSGLSRNSRIKLRVPRKGNLLLMRNKQIAFFGEGFSRGK